MIKSTNEFVKIYSRQHFIDKGFHEDAEGDIWESVDLETQYLEGIEEIEDIGYVDCLYFSSVTEIFYVYKNFKENYTYYNEATNGYIAIEPWMGYKVNKEDHPEEFI